jgi:hypothetical protein
MSKITALVAVFGAVLAIAACSPTASTDSASPTATIAIAVPSSNVTACRAGSDSGEPLPDPHCTPGATNPAVTQATIHTTICVSGWTATVRPDTSYTNRLKARGIKDYGYGDSSLSSYEEDHLVPLEAGGAPSDPANLWPELGRSPNTKDKVESAARKAVCTGRMPLATAQAGFETDWVTLGRQLGVRIP